MDTRKACALPAQLEGVRRRFEHWRLTQPVRSRISDSLWASAVKMAGMYGIHRTAKALRINYYALKKRTEQKATSALDVPPQNAVSTFVELAPPWSAGSGECTVEWEDTGGAKMRVHLKGCAAPDLAALSRSFWDLRS
jgi:hypothetical protein